MVRDRRHGVHVLTDKQFKNPAVGTGEGAICPVRRTLGGALAAATDVRWSLEIRGLG